MKKLVKFFLFAYILVFPFGQLARLPIHFFGPEVRVYLGDVLVGLAVGIWGVKRVKRAKKGKRGNRGNRGLAKAILAFAGVVGLSLLVNIPRLAFNEALVSSFYFLRWIVYAGLYFVVRDIVKTKNQKPKTKNTNQILKNFYNSLFSLLIISGGITAIFGLLQYFFFPDLRAWLEVRHWDPHYFRAYGAFFDPGFFGMIMVLGLILLTVELLIGKRVLSDSPSKNTIYYILYTIYYLALALTYSRSSYLAYLVGMGVIAWKLKKPKFYAAVIGIFLLTLLLLPRPGGEGVRLERGASIKARIINWKQSLKIAKDHPIFGVGFNAYRYAQRDYGFLDPEDWQFSHAGAGADSSLLFVFATTGIVGLTSYLYLWRKIFVTYHISHITYHSLIVFASLAALFVHSLFLNSLFYPWIMGWMWILIGARNACPPAPSPAGHGRREFR